MANHRTEVRPRCDSGRPWECWASAGRCPMVHADAWKGTRFRWRLWLQGTQMGMGIGWVVSFLLELVEFMESFGGIWVKKLDLPKFGWWIVNMNRSCSFPGPELLTRWVGTIPGLPRITVSTLARFVWKLGGPSHCVDNFPLRLRWPCCLLAWIRRRIPENFHVPPTTNLVLPPSLRSSTWTFRWCNALPRWKWRSPSA